MPLPILGGILTSIGGKLISSLIGKATDVVDQLVQDKDLAARLKAELTTQFMAFNLTKFTAELEAQRSVLVAEIGGQSWLQRNWRPGLMCLFGIIILNNYVIYPYLSMLAPEIAVSVPVPEPMWSLLKLGISGYLVGRSMEKISEGGGVRRLAANLTNGKNS